VGALTTFVDTSALYALLAADDDNHPAAGRTFDELADAESLVSHSYVLLETATIVQKRLGMDAVRSLLDGLVGVLEVDWVDETLHRAAAGALLAAGRRDVSLVDWTSFEFMRRRGLTKAFAYDLHYSQQGFQLVG
jgi:uncharacterized protein